MTTEVIAAEARPRPERATQAARALQRLGFRVFHVGATISIQGSQALWETVFGVSFTPRSEAAEDTGFFPSLPPAAVEGTLRVPPELEGLIDEVTFVHPPEFFR
jgi:hypothetical protein